MDGRPSCPEKRWKNYFFDDGEEICARAIQLTSIHTRFARSSQIHKNKLVCNNRKKNSTNHTNILCKLQHFYTLYPLSHFTW